MVATTEGAHAFDFLHGNWNVANRKLMRRLAGSSDWDEFAGTAVCRGFFDGAANIDQIDFPTLGFTGMTLRLFDPEREQWSLYWANSRDGLLQPPVAGRFANGRGDFYGEDTDDNQPIHVHYLWSEITPQSARWQQAFSLDGESWETNWIMQFTRVA
jgi:hypothetical protein